MPIADILFILQTVSFSLTKPGNVYESLSSVIRYQLTYKKAYVQFLASAVERTSGEAREGLKSHNQS